MMYMHVCIWRRLTWAQSPLVVLQEASTCGKRGAAKCLTHVTFQRRAMRIGNWLGEVINHDSFAYLRQLSDDECGKSGFRQDGVSTSGSLDRMGMCSLRKKSPLENPAGTNGI